MSPYVQLSNNDWISIAFKTFTSIHDSDGSDTQNLNFEIAQIYPILINDGGKTLQFIQLLIVFYLVSEFLGTYLNPSLNSTRSIDDLIFNTYVVLKIKYFSAYILIFMYSNRIIGTGVENT